MGCNSTAQVHRAASYFESGVHLATVICQSPSIIWFDSETLNRYLWSFLWSHQIEDMRPSHRNTAQTKLETNYRNYVNVHADCKLYNPSQLLPLAKETNSSPIQKAIDCDGAQEFVEGSSGQITTVGIWWPAWWQGLLLDCAVLRSFFSRHIQLKRILEQFHASARER